LCARGGERLFAALRPHREALGVDELHVGDADEAEDLAHVGAVGIGGGAGVQAAARREHVGLLAGEQPDRTLVRVLERHAGARDVVDPGLELGRHAEVVHRQAEHHHVGATQLVDQPVRVGDDRLLRLVSLLRLLEERLETLGVEVRHRRAREVAHRQACARVLAAQAGDEIGAEAARLAVLRVQARVDLKDVHLPLHSDM
jgi:hypothetical protein